MKEPKKRNIPVLVAIITTVLVLAALAVGIVLLQNGDQTDADTGTTAPVLDYDLYWNLDRAEHMNQSELGSSSRRKESDGYYHISFFIDGKTVDLKVAEKQVVNDIDVNDVVGLTFDENGIVVGMSTVWDMPCQVTAWNYYVRSTEETRIMLNSSPLYNGDEQVLMIPEGLDIYDMTGAEGEIGKVIFPGAGDRLIAISNAEGILTHVFVSERKDFMHASEGYCEHCKETVNWVEYDETDKLPFSESGHYKLQNDIKLNAQQGVGADKKICIDLNGFTVEGKESQRVIALSAENAELAIMDSSEGKTGRIVAHNQEENTKQGILLFLHKSDAYLYGGILDASDAITNGTGGAAVYVAANRTFTMNGGEIIGGTAVPEYQKKSNSYRYGNGGSVGVMGKFIMNDGVIRDGVAKSGVVWKNGKANYQRGMGGNVYVGTSGVFEMNGGTIKDGKAGTAGNVFLDGAGEFVMNGGTIADGRATDPGREAGNINFLTKAKFTMNGGTISGGSSSGTAGSISTRGTFTMNGGAIYGGYVFDKDTGKVKDSNIGGNLLAQNGANITITGGRIYGRVLVRDTDEKDKLSTYLTLSGGASIWSDDEGVTNLSLPTSKEPVKVSVKSLYNSAKIGVSASGIFSLETDEKNVDNFVSDVPEAEVVYVDKCLAVGKLACLCGSKTETHLGECDGAQLLWAPWNTANNLPTADGNYYLVTDVALAANKNIGARDKQVNVNLDLNGHTVESAQRALVCYGNMNIADHTGGGQIIGAGVAAKKDHGGVVIAFTNSTLSIYGGTIKLADKHHEITNAGVMTVGANAVVNLYGGTIDGRSAHQAVEGDGASAVEHGGVVRLSGTLNLLGGEVYGGDVTGRGGAIYLQDKTAVLNIDGGTIHGGTAKTGGSIYVNNGVVNMTKGLITGGTGNGAGSGDHGGSVYVGPSGVFTITGGTVEKGVSLNRNGGNIACRGKLVIGGDAKVLDGTAKTVNSHNIYMQGGEITLSGNAQISGGVSVASVSKDGAKISLSGAVTVANAETGDYLNLGRTGTNPVPVIQITGALCDGDKKANITVKLATTSGVFAQGADYTLTEEDAACFTAQDTGLNVKLEKDNTLILTEEGAVETEIRCLCKTGDKPWCDHTQETWLAWNGKTQLQDGKNYYLTKSVDDGKKISLTGISVKLDLNGYTYASVDRAIQLRDAQIHIVDSSYSTGMVTGKGVSGKIDNGAVFHVVSSTVNIYSGTYAMADDHNQVGNGGVMVVGGTATVNIYGGTIGTETSANPVANGGAINFAGTALNIYGGTIKSNSNVTGNGKGINVTAGTVTVGGDAVIENIYLPTGTVIGIDESFDIAKASVTADVQTVGVFAQGIDGFILTDAVKERFAPANAEYTLTLDAAQNALVLSSDTAPQPVERCLCKTGDKPWCDHTVETWLPWDGTGSLQDGKNYYLTTDVTDGSAISIVNKNVKLDLNGNSYAAKERALMINTNSQVHIVDSSYATGTLTGNGLAAKNNGGVFHVLNATLNIYSGTYALGQNHNEIGNGGVMVVGGTATVSIYGGTIGGESSAKAIAQGGAINFGGTALNIYGGTIKANSAVTGNGSGICMTAGTVTVGGDAVIENIYLPTDKVIGIDESFDTTKASVTVDVQTVGIFAQGADGFILTDAVKERFAPANTEYTLTLDAAQNALVLSSDTAPQPVERCLCKTGDKPWCDHTQETWLPWDGTGSLQDGKSYYLTTSVTNAATIAINGIQVKLDLNGFCYDATNRAFELKNGAVMCVVDSSYATGTLTGNGPTAKSDGGVFHVLNSTLNLYSGTYALGQNHNEIGNGGVMVVGGTATVNIYGGTIGNETTAKPVANGGAINFGGTALNIYGGTIKANSAVTGNGKGINMTAGTVTVGGDAVIENIYLPTGKTLVVADGFDPDNASVTVQMQTPGVFTADTSVGLSNEASKGFCSGNKDYVVVYDGQSYLLEEAQAVDSNCLCGKDPHEAWCTQTVPQVWTGTGLPTQTGNYKLTASVEVSEPVVIPDGVYIKLWLEGNNITPAENATLTNIFTVEDGGFLALMDSTETKGTVSAKAGMTRVITSDGELLIDGAGVNASAITAGTENGVGICINAGTFTLTDGLLTGGKTTTKSGGTVYVAVGATMTMEGGKLTGGQGKTGGNLAVQGDAQITGGEITAGLAEIGGNILVNNGGDLQASGGSILNGRFTSRGGNIGIEENGTATLSDDVIISGGVHNTNANTNPDRANISLFSSGKSGSLTLSNVNLPEGKILVVNSGKNPVVYLSGTVKVGGGDKGLKLGRTGSNKMATIQIGEAGLNADSAIDLSANNTGSNHVLVTGLTEVQKTALLANNNFTICNNGFKLGEKANGDKFDLILMEQ